ncbi:MAG: hypothetical protein ACOYMZ_01965 [Minisyncoccia bacterium]
MEKKGITAIVSKILNARTQRKELEKKIAKKRNIEKSAKDFATRFETVMRELSNG